jgi:uncharacterized membrane protein
VTLVLLASIDPYLRDWADLLVRWLHVVAAIGWVGSSFYFVLLDQSLRTPKRESDIDAGVGGELWEVHGGGFYHVQKYKVAPPELPDHLAWFKWEAYTTWLTGFTLVVLLYWLDAKSYLIDSNVADLSEGTAVAISAALLAGAWIIYDLACRFVRNERLLQLIIVAGIVAAAWGTSELFSARASWLQLGAMLGTIMAANVFFNIIPAHRELIRAKEEGRDPDPAPGIEAKRRSVHNNYFTLPVLITMLAGHFTFLTGRDNAWVILLALMALGAWARLFFNQRHSGNTRWWMPVAAGLVVVAMIVVLKPEDQPPAAAGDPSDALVDKGESVFQEASCGSCHTMEVAGAAGTAGPNLDDAEPPAGLVIERVTNGKGGMPAFSSQLNEDEIKAVAAYVALSAGPEATASEK